jgi:hypothetical protein
MKTTAKVLAIFLVMFFGYSSQAQNYISHCYQCENPDKTYKKTGYNATIELSEGKTKDMTLKLKSGRDYYINVDGKKSLGNVHFIIKRVDDNGVEYETLYDNSINEFASDYAFTANENIKIAVKITSQPTNWYKTKNKANNIDVVLAYK